MPVKAGLEENCYLYDATFGEMGWAKELNSFPYEEIES